MPEYKYSRIEHSEPPEGLYDEFGRKENVAGRSTEKLQSNRRYHTISDDCENKKK